MGERLRTKGFAEAAGEDVICRWTHGRLLLDVMPTDPAVLSFSNPWYPLAAASAQPYTLPSGATVRLVSAPLLLATKLVSFHDRGHSDTGLLDYLHHDLEDIITVVNGRPGLLDEVQHSPTEVQGFLSDEFDQLLMDGAFLAKLPWLLAEPDREELVLERLRRLAGL